TSLPRAVPRACRRSPSLPASRGAWRSRSRTGTPRTGRAARARWRHCGRWACSTRRPSTGAWPSSRRHRSTTHGERRRAMCDRRSRWAEPMVRYVALGDSYSIGTGVEPDEAWPRQLASRLAALDLDLIANLGVNGSTADDVAAEQMPDLESLQPELASL